MDEGALKKMSERKYRDNESGECEEEGDERTMRLMMMTVDKKSGGQTLPCNTWTRESDHVQAVLLIDDFCTVTGIH